MRLECEWYQPKRKRHKATVCVIWDRDVCRVHGDIRHRHLCESHANQMANGYSQGDRWQERTLAECAACI